MQGISFMGVPDLSPVSLQTMQTCSGCGRNEMSGDPTPDQRWLCQSCVDGSEPEGCSICRQVGPLLTGPGSSGRSWSCSECRHVWSPAPAVAAS